MSEFEKAREEYRLERASTFDNTAVSPEAAAARRYIAQLERKVGELEAHLRARTSRGKW